ncbi:MAG: FimV/HubP family polar landmark protein [Pseudomonadales bacterium]
MKEKVGELMREMLQWSLIGVLLIGANTALGLGLGRIDVQSVLNQPLAAEIQLLNASEWAANDLKVGLASPDEFERLGVERSIGLFDLEFKAVQRGSNIVIQTITEDAIVEPFLHFVLVLDWPRGRLLKEYTVLLDLPPTQGVIQPLMPRAGFETKSSRAVEQASPARISVGSTGQLTTIGDTLWDIALATRPDRSISIPQMMMAIQQANPEAFINGNINRLKAGYALKIPSFETAMSISDRLAEAEVDAQNRALAGGSTQKKTASDEPGQLVPQADRIEPGVSDSDGGDFESSGAELRLISDDEPDQVVNVADDEVLAIKAELADKEQALKMAAEEQAMTNDRLANLETQLGSLTSLIEVKDQELARLQQSLESLKNQPAPVSSIWANPLVLALFVVIVLLVVLILVLSNRLRQQTRWLNDGPAAQQSANATAAVAEAAQSPEPRTEQPDVTETSDVRHESEVDVSSQLGESNGQTENTTESTPGQEPNDLSDELSEVDLDLEISESLDLDIDAGLEEIDLEESPDESDAMGHPLDLARAYIEMGDRTAARAQLAKVIATGAPAEVQEAEQLLERLAD